MKKYKLKAVDMRLMVNGIGMITGTISETVYKAVMEINPALAEYFEEVTEAPPGKKKDSGNA